VEASLLLLWAALVFAVLSAVLLAIRQRRARRPGAPVA
jgi:hypothetical protein